MPKTIKITGTGKASAKPDLAELTLTLSSRDKVYEKAAKQSESDIAALQEAVKAAGFERDELKTADLRVNAEYEGVHVDGEYKQVFKGYRVTQVLRLSFALYKELLNKTLSAVMSCKAAPEISIRFLVKDAEAFKDELLKNAAENAKKTAGTLCAASGVKLGAIVSIDYSFSESYFYSRTVAGIDGLRAAPFAAKADIEPEDVSASESVTFVWEIE